MEQRDRPSLFDSIFPLSDRKAHTGRLLDMLPPTLNAVSDECGFRRY
jgi:hypothetical protein